MNETEELETRNKLETRNRWTTLRNYKQINKKKKEERNMETMPEKDGNFIRNSHLQARERREKEWSCRERIKQCRWDWKDLAYLFFWSRIEISFSFVEERVSVAVSGIEFLIECILLVGWQVCWGRRETRIWKIGGVPRKCKTDVASQIYMRETEREREETTGCEERMTNFLDYRLFFKIIYI